MEVSNVKTYKFKLYNSKKNRKLQHQLWIASKIYNHCIALHKRYWHLFHRSLSKNKLQKHLTRIKKLPKYQYWQELPSSVGLLAMWETPQQRPECGQEYSI